MGGNKAVYFYSHLAKQGNCWWFFNDLYHWSIHSKNIIFDFLHCLLYLYIDIMVETSPFWRTELNRPFSSLTPDGGNGSNIKYARKSGEW
jgi:hypothetical protein